MDATIDQNELKHLLHLAAAGNRSAFEQLYGLTAGRLFAVGLRMLREREAAEEALQEAFIKIWHNAGEYHAGRGTVLTWMTAIMRYRVLDRMRAVKRDPTQSDNNSMDVIANDPAPADLAALEQDSRELKRCMEALQPNQQQAISLAFLNGFTHGEVTTVLNKPLGTIKSLIRRGLKDLHRCLQR